MNSALWAAQGWLAALFLIAGAIKTFQPKEKMPAQMSWVHDYSAGMVKFVGIAELLGGIGLVVPWLTGIAPLLTPLAAVGLAVIMVLAIAYHLRKQEKIVMNLVLLALCLFVAYGRFAF
ncbi:DoxX-like family protein [Catalinimonas alkaloidigena]|uniref:DoxX-like family protein n=1 Tax=Catalinimonas alkaloidigena TaxID=1075417 RepID=A0A1G8XMS6_9BACT|nr:DoxX family protein [Catalinimonas alkaloidigena]SDJ91793.1 DoxX-like family protein [Catalinimonas alkaloidigena]